MNVIAHRGDHTTHPENTLPAFQAALTAGAYGVEFDIRLTADRVPVVFHYFSLMGTTGTGFVCDHTYDEIRQVRVLAGTGERENPAIASLQEVLETFGGKLYLELHVQPTAPEVIAAVADVLEDYRSVWSMLEITSYEPAVLLGFQNRCRGIDTDLLFPRSEDWMSPAIAVRLAVDKARLARARGVHLHPDQLSPELIDFVFRHELAVHCWDVKSIEAWNTLESLGVEQFTTDNIRLFLDTLQR